MATKRSDSMEQAAQRHRNREQEMRRNDRQDVVRDKKLDGPNRPAE